MDESARKFFNVQAFLIIISYSWSQVHNFMSSKPKHILNVQPALRNNWDGLYVIRFILFFIQSISPLIFPLNSCLYLRLLDLLEIEWNYPLW